MMVHRLTAKRFTCRARSALFAADRAPAGSCVTDLTLAMG